MGIESLTFCGKPFGEKTIKVTLKLQPCVITVCRVRFTCAGYFCSTHCLLLDFFSANSELARSWNREDPIWSVTSIWYRILGQSFNLTCHITEAKSSGEERGFSITHWTQAGCKDTNRNPCFRVFGWKNRWGGGVSAEKPLHREELTFQKRKHFLMTWAKDRMSTTNSFLKQQISSYQKSRRRGTSLPPSGILESSSTRHWDHPASRRVTGPTGDLAVPQKPGGTFPWSLLHYPNALSRYCSQVIPLAFWLLTLRWTQLCPATITLSVPFCHKAPPLPATGML